MVRLLLSIAVTHYILHLLYCSTDYTVYSDAFWTWQLILGIWDNTFLMLFASVECATQCVSTNPIVCTIHHDFSILPVSVDFPIVQWAKSVLLQFLSQQIQV